MDRERLGRTSLRRQFGGTFGVALTIALLAAATTMAGFDRMRGQAYNVGLSDANLSKRELCVRVIQDWYDEIIAAIEAGLPRQQPVREQLEFVVLTHLRLFLIQGTGLCALVLSEGRTKGQDLGEGFVELQRRYTAPLMDLLSRGQKAGEVREDIPLRMLRSLVFGPMEHLLWEVIIAGREIQVDRAARDLVALLWPALQAPDHELQSLRRFKAQVGAAMTQAEGGSAL